MKIYPTLAVGVLAAAAASHQSWALGLGELTLFSYLNEPFRAEIELLEADALDDSDVHVDLAPDTEFERLGVSREFFLTRIDFEIESDESGRRAVLTTEAPLREPYLDFVIEARWPDGRLLREYTVLIDLPPRQNVSASAGAGSASEITAIESARSDMADVASEAPAPRDYDASVSPRPAPGAEYLVTSNDTLWRIATEGAVSGVSVEQTMLEIVAANPTAFLGGNINGLKSGYVLKIPGPDNIRIDLATALEEVAIQNDEWQRGVSRTAQSLTLVADSALDDAVAEAAELEAVDDAASGTPASYALDDAGSDTLAPSTATVSKAELDALTATVTRLESSLQSLEAQLAERDEELAALRAAMAAQPMAASAPVVVEAAAPPVPASVSKNQSLPLWPFLTGLLVLIAGVGAIIWRRRPTPDGAAEHESAEAIVSLQADEEVATSRLSDPQIMASKAVEEAQIYIAYGRTDQAVEVLREAIAEGLSSPTLNMCLLECYVELQQFAEVGELLSRLEQSESPELLSRARQMLLDAGIALTPSAKSDMDSSHDEVAVEPEESSVLSELSFSTAPTFDLQDEPLPEVEVNEDMGEVFADQGITEDRGAGGTEEAMSDFHGADDSQSDSIGTPYTSGLSLEPIEGDADLPGQNLVESACTDESIYGAETDPVDSKLDLARAYIDMGDEDGARPVLMDVIKEGDLAQQAEARELFLRLDAS